MLERRVALEAYVNEKEKEILTKTDALQKKKTEVEKQLQPYLDKINMNKFQIEQNNNTANLIEQNNKKKNNELEITKSNYENVNTTMKTKLSQLSDIEKSVNNLKENLKQEKQNLDLLLQTYDNLSKEKVVLQQKLSEVKNSNQENSQRNAMIEKLLKAQGEGQLQGIYGRLGDLGAIDQKYDIAATTSCNKLNNIVVDTADQGQKCIEYLRKNKLGRGDFIVLEKVQWVKDQLSKVFKAPNNTERLFDLIKIPNKKLIPAFYFGFRDTLVTEDLKIAQQVGYGSTRHRVVTLTGDLIEVSGVMSGGGKAMRGGMSSKITGEINPEELQKLQNDFNAISKELDNLRTQKQNFEKNIQNLNQQIMDHVSMNKKLESDLDILDKSKRELEKTLNVLKKDEEKLKKANDEIEKLRNLNKEIDENIAQDEKDCKSYKESLDKILQEINKVSGDDYLGKFTLK